MHTLIEVSSQNIPPVTELVGDPGLSFPLHGLADIAPAVPDHYDIDSIKYPISNDELAPIVDQMQARTQTAEYQAATNRTAILVGESSLMSILPHIPEENIILLDRDPQMCSYMQRYVDSLRAAPTNMGWARLMELDDVANGSYGVQNVAGRTLVQLHEAERDGYTHAADDDELYAQAHRLANEKAIIVWNGDLMSRGDMKFLGDTLKENDANVTLMNMTNALIATGNFDTSRAAARMLGRLPVTPNAPILTTSYRTKRSPTPELPSMTVEATGPFFGLRNLKKYGGKVKPGNNNALVERSYIEVESTEEPAVNLEDLLLQYNRNFAGRTGLLGFGIDIASLSETSGHTGVVIKVSHQEGKRVLEIVTTYERGDDDQQTG